MSDQQMTPVHNQPLGPVATTYGPLGAAASSMPPLAPGAQMVAQQISWTQGPPRTFGQGSPDKERLKSEVAQLQHENTEVKTSALDALQQKRAGFITAAQQYEQEARDVCNLEVAQEQVARNQTAAHLAQTQDVANQIASRMQGQHVTLQSEQYEVERLRTLAQTTADQLSRVKAAEMQTQEFAIGRLEQFS